MKPSIPALIVLLAACGTPLQAETTTTTVPSTTTTTAPSEAARLSYTYSPDTRLTYSVEVDQRLTMVADGDEGALGPEPSELPFEADLHTTLASDMVFSVHPGPRDGTYEIEITGDFSSPEVAGTVNGEPFDPGEDGDMLGSDLAELTPIDATAIVDEQGNVVSARGLPGDDLLAGDLAQLGGLAGGGLGRPLGPAFPDHELAVGDTWTDERTEEGPDGPITVLETHTVTGTDEVDGREVLVIESLSEMDAFDVDFSHFFRGMFEGLAGMGSELGGETSTDTTLPPEVQELLDQIVFRISIEPSTGDATTWFDPLEGIVRRTVQAHVVSMSIEFAAPDETTGEIAGFTMDMTIDQDVTFTLESVGAAAD